MVRDPQIVCAIERIMTHFVFSLRSCDVPGCDNKAIISNSRISNGLRCLDHAPESWILEAQRYLMYMKREHEQREKKTLPLQPTVFSRHY